MMKMMMMTMTMTMVQFSMGVLNSNAKAAKISLHAAKCLLSLSLQHAQYLGGTNLGGGQWHMAMGGIGVDMY